MDKDLEIVPLPPLKVKETLQPESQKTSADSVNSKKDSHASDIQKPVDLPDPWENPALPNDPNNDPWAITDQLENDPWATDDPAVSKSFWGVDNSPEGSIGQATHSNVESRSTERCHNSELSAADKTVTPSDTKEQRNKRTKQVEIKMSVESAVTETHDQDWVAQIRSPDDIVNQSEGEINPETMTEVVADGTSKSETDRRHVINMEIEEINEVKSAREGNPSKVTDDKFEPLNEVHKLDPRCEFDDQGSQLYVIEDSDSDGEQTVRDRLPWQPVAKQDPFPLREHLYLSLEEV